MNRSRIMIFTAAGFAGALAVAGIAVASPERGEIRHGGEIHSSASSTSGATTASQPDEVEPELNDDPATHEINDDPATHDVGDDNGVDAVDDDNDDAVIDPNAPAPARTDNSGPGNMNDTTEHPDNSGHGNANDDTEDTQPDNSNSGSGNGGGNSGSGHGGGGNDDAPEPADG